MKKIFKMTLWIIVGAIAALCLTVFLFVKFSPEMGGTPSKQDIENYQKSKNYKEGLFQNLIETNMDMSFSSGMKTMWQFIKGVKNGRPESELPLNKVDSTFLEINKPDDKIIWFGHSTFLLQMEGRNILIDPMFGQVAAPHPALGQNRYNKELPIEVEKLPKIDMILLSHDHYDHLDYNSIMRLKDKTDLFIVPLGVGRHFREWGIDNIQIKELDWWDKKSIDNLEIVFTPSRHFSGRGLNDRFTTLWGSYVIKSGKQNIYFSGDGGYGPHFKEIGDKYGPFDFAMIECGQYDEKWADIHMMPEESAQAGVDLKAKVAMPIHWGAFTLALHSWVDPVERIRAKAQELSLPLITPKIGEVIRLDSTISNHQEVWWPSPN